MAAWQHNNRAIVAMLSLLCCFDSPGWRLVLPPSPAAVLRRRSSQPEIGRLRELAASPVAASRPSIRRDHRDKEDPEPGNEHTTHPAHDVNLSRPLTR